MIEIGPNLLAAILAVVSLCTAVVAAWRAERAHAVSSAAQATADRNSARLDQVEKVNGK